MGLMFRKFLGGEETEVESILRNLGYVLTAKRGASSILPDYGLTDLVAGTAEEYFLWLDREVRQTIDRYEPRVEVVEVEEDVDDDGQTRMRLSLRIRSSQESLQLLLDPQRREVRAPPEDDEA